MKYLLIILSLVVVGLYTLLQRPDLFFVDSARYADVARSFVEDGKFVIHSNFPSGRIEGEWLFYNSVLHVVFISIFFKLFGISDRSVILESTFFFILTLPILFLLAKKIFNQRVALISCLFYLFSSQLLGYAFDGGSDPIFIFEITLIAYFISLKKEKFILLAGVVGALTLFTKLHSYLFLANFLVWIFLLHKKVRNLALFLLFPVLAFLLNKFGVLFAHFKFDIPFYLSLQSSSLYPSDSLPRSGMTSKIDIWFLANNIKVFVSKIFYNLYNYFKIFNFDNLLPALSSPLVVVSFLLSYFNFQTKNNDQKIFRLIVLLMVISSLGLASATAPHIRYIQLTLPFIFIIAADFLDKLFKSNTKLTFLIIILVILPIFGEKVLDSRFKAKTFNTDKPFTHQVLGEAIGKETLNSAVVLTNLDSWGAWYGRRKTILIPNEISQVEEVNKKVKISYIFLTDFQKDNEDHPLRGDWDLDKFSLENFLLEKIATISATQVYENQPFTYKVFKKTD